MPENTILCTANVVGLYPSIPHEKGLQAMREFLDTRTDKNISTDTLVSLARVVLGSVREQFF